MECFIYIWIKINLSKLRFITYVLLSLLTVVVHVLTMRKMAAPKAPNALKNYLKKFYAAHKPLTEII